MAGQPLVASETTSAKIAPALAPDEEEKSRMPSAPGCVGAARRVDRVRRADDQRARGLAEDLGEPGAGTVPDAIRSSSTRPGPTGASWSTSPTSSTCVRGPTAPSSASARRTSSIDASSTTSTSSPVDRVLGPAREALAGHHSSSRWIVVASRARRLGQPPCRLAGRRAQTHRPRVWAHEVDEGPHRRRLAGARPAGEDREPARRAGSDGRPLPVGRDELAARRRRCRCAGSSAAPPSRAHGRAARRAARGGPSAGSDDHLAVSDEPPAGDQLVDPRGGGRAAAAPRRARASSADGSMAVSVALGERRAWSTPASIRSGASPAGRALAPARRPSRSRRRPPRVAAYGSAAELVDRRRARAPCSTRAAAAAGTPCADRNSRSARRPRLRSQERVAAPMRAGRCPAPRAAARADRRRRSPARLAPWRSSRYRRAVRADVLDRPQHGQQRRVA